MLSISVKELKNKINGKEEFYLVDVREPWEHEAFHIGGELIPLGSLFDNLDRIKEDQPVIIYCEKGIRSQLAIQRLQQKKGYTNLVNLTGGMTAWKKDL